MFEIIRIAFLLSLSFSFHTATVFEDGYLELYVKDVTGKPVRNILMACDMDCNASMSDRRGKVRLKLIATLKPGDQVSIKVGKRSGRSGWVLISPWDDQVNIPSFENKREKTTQVVIVRVGDKRILSSGIALQSLAQRALKQAPEANKTPSEEDKNGS